MCYNTAHITYKNMLDIHRLKQNESVGKGEYEHRGLVSATNRRAIYMGACLTNCRLGCAHSAGRENLIQSNSKSHGPTVYQC
jgi:hypothetical protein